MCSRIRSSNAACASFELGSLQEGAIIGEFIGELQESLLMLSIREFATRSCKWNCYQVGSTNELWSEQASWLPSEWPSNGPLNLVCHRSANHLNPFVLIKTEQHSSNCLQSKRSKLRKCCPTLSLDHHMAISDCWTVIRSLIEVPLWRRENWKSLGFGRDPKLAFS